MPSHPPAEGGPGSGSPLQDTTVLLSPRFSTLYPGQAPEPVSAFLEPGCETGLSFVVSTSGGAGLVSADYSRALGQPGSEEEAQLQKNTELGHRENYGGQKPSLLDG